MAGPLPNCHSAKWICGESKSGYAGLRNGSMCSEDHALHPCTECQGIAMSKYTEKTAEQELAEKKRQMPFHMHISLDLLESCALISAMLIEVPAMAANPLAAQQRKRSAAKSFHRILDTYSRQTFTGARKGGMSRSWPRGGRFPSRLRLLHRDLPCKDPVRPVACCSL